MKKLLYTLFIFSMLFSLSLCCSAADTAGKVVTSGGRLNVRSSPSSSASVITSVPNSSWLTLTDKNGSWYKAEYADGKSGWCHSDYIKAYPDTREAAVSLKSGHLNVRSGSGTSYPVIDRLYSGENAVILYGNNNWSRILYDGNKIGYVSSVYLRELSQTSYPAISLSVPSYKQTDSRWSSYPIGTYGDTIGTIGCTTTALAMTESYHTFSTVTPPQMAQRLSYSPSGMLYWPSSYSVSYSQSDYLTEIYNLLKKGKPVVFGATNSRGSQHWVTVTGYNGNSARLTASGFTVNDPGSKTRLTLDAFLAAYPNPYKTVYRK